MAGADAIKLHEEDYSGRRSQSRVIQRLLPSCVTLGNYPGFIWWLICIWSRHRDEKAAVAVTVGYESSTSEGAVLLTKGNVVRSMAMPKWKLYDWVEDNLDKLAKIR